VATALGGVEVGDFGALTSCAHGLVARFSADSIGGVRWVEARADDHGEVVLVPAIGVGEGVEILDVDVDLLAGLDVGNRLGEDVGALLGEQRGDETLGARFGIAAFGFFALADDA